MAEPTSASAASAKPLGARPDAIRPGPAVRPAPGAFPVPAVLRRLLRHQPSLAGLAACLAGYMVAAAFGQWMMVVPSLSVTIWPPNGVVLAFLLLNRRATWPWWIAIGAAGELAGNLLWFHNPALPALGYIAANALEVLAAALMISSAVTTVLTRLTTLRQVLAFLGLGVLLAPVVGATIGSAIVAAVGKQTFAVTWMAWWLGDATGILLATPLAISMLNMWRERSWPRAMHLAEGVVIAAVLIALGLWQFSIGLPHAFLLLVPILWAALRFEMRGATLSALLLALIIGHSAQGDVAPPAGSAVYQHTMLQALMIVAASLGLIVAATIRQFRQAVSDLSVSNATLERRVAERTRAIEAAERRFKATFENAAVGICIVDPDGAFLSVNESLTRMLGYSAAELEGRSVDEITHPDSLEEGRRARQRLRDGTADNYVLEKKYIRADGAVVWGHTSGSSVRNPQGQIEYLIKVIQDITERKRSDAMRQVLMREVNHRSKNLLSVAQAIARQTSAGSPREFAQTFGRRLQALAANQDLLVESGWQLVRLDDLIRRQLDHLGDGLQARTSLVGPTVMLSARAAQALGMALHELATNALKYGSMRNETGRVKVEWSSSEGAFTITWTETGGPPVTAPERSGFGTTLTKAMVEAALGGRVTLDYRPEGLQWRLETTLAALRSEADQPQGGAAPGGGGAPERGAG